MTASPIDNGGPRLRSAGRRVTPERLARIADVAVDLAVESGFAAVTMQAVAKRAGYVRPVVYDCYGNPENLLLTVLERERESLTEQLAHAAGQDEPTGRLLAWAGVAAANSRSWRLFTLPTEGAPDSVRAAVREFRERLRGDIADWLADLTAARPGPVDTEALSVLLLAAIDAVGDRLATDPEAYDPARAGALLRSMSARLHLSAPDH